MSKGDFGWVWYACLVCYCLGITLLIRGGKPGIDNLNGIVLSCLTAYGGGTLVPLLLGKPGVMVSTEWAVPAIIAAWIVTSFSAAQSVLRTLPFRLVIHAGVEILRLYTLMGTINLCYATIKPPAWYPVPTVPALLCGLIGGCGGMFLPSIVPTYATTASLANGPNWAMKAALFHSVWLQLTTRDPNAAPYVGFADPMHAQALSGVIVAFVLPLLAVFANITPFGPPVVVALAASKPAGKTKKA